MGTDPYRSFFRRLPFTLVVAMVVWLLLRPALDSAVAGFAELLIRSFEHPRVTNLVAADHRVEVRRTDFRSDSRIPTIPMTENNFNTIVLLALYLALPRPFSRRQLERLFMGWSILYCTHALNLLLHVKCMYAMGLGDWSLQTYSDFSRNLFGYGRYFTDLPGRFSFPFLIWLGFNWDLVSTLVRARADDPAPPAKRKTGGR